MLMSRLCLLGLAVSVANADEISFSLSTAGSTSSGAPSDLTFVGIGNTLTAGYTGTTVGSTLVLTDLGIFTLQKPNQGADPYHNETFTLDVSFSSPAGLIGKSTFNASLNGVVNTQQGSVSIDFGPTQTFRFFNSIGSGSFDLTINDLTLNIPHDGTTSISQSLTGSITHASDPPLDSTVPEPQSIVLLGSIALFVSSRIRRGHRPPTVG